MDGIPICDTCRAGLDEVDMHAYCEHRSVLYVRTDPDGNFAYFRDLAVESANQLILCATDTLCWETHFEGLRNINKQRGTGHPLAIKRAAKKIQWRLAAAIHGLYQHREKAISAKDTLLCPACAERTLPASYVGYCPERGVLYIGTEPEREFFGDLLWLEVSPHLKELASWILSGPGQQRLQNLMAHGQLDELDAMSLIARPAIKKLRAAIRKLVADKAAAERTTPRH